ncbi:MAG: iron-containing alcohol dehydrogenase [Spirochaetes bacterium]|nr:iron-containing alcohol dehydrogenase [Spirochaetota bacterium]
MEILPEFHIPTQIFIREEVLQESGLIVNRFGSRAIIVTTSSEIETFEHIVKSIASQCEKAGVKVIVYDEIGDVVNTEKIDSAVHFIKKTKCDTIIGFGGINSINAAKAIALLVNNFLFCEELFDYPNVNNPINFITIPSCPLFGFEIIPMFFINDIRENVKKCYENRFLFPMATIIDPKIAMEVTEETIIGGSISSLAIATESVISKKNNGLINTLALRAIDLIFKNLPAIYRDPNNIIPRSQLSLASMMSGIAFSIANLSVTLAISLAINSVTTISLEDAMGLILPHIMEYNLTSSPGKYVQMSKVMEEDVRDITVIEAAIKAVEGVRKLEMEMDVPQRLSQFEIPKTELSKIADIAITYPFLDNAPRPISKNEIETILIAAY